MRIHYSAYPTTEDHMNGGSGLSVQELAAIKLRVPDSGDEHLDAMIKQANRRDLAGQALAGLCNRVRYDGDGPVATAMEAVEHADALIAELEKRPPVHGEGRGV